MRGGGFFRGGKSFGGGREEGENPIQATLLPLSPLHNAGSGFFRQIKQWGKGRDVFWGVLSASASVVHGSHTAKPSPDREKKKKKSWNV